MNKHQNNKLTVFIKTVAIPVEIGETSALIQIITEEIKRILAEYNLTSLRKIVVLQVALQKAKSHELKRWPQRSNLPPAIGCKRNRLFKKREDDYNK